MWLRIYTTLGVNKFGSQKPYPMAYNDLEPQLRGVPMPFFSIPEASHPHLPTQGGIYTHIITDTMNL